MNEMDSFLWTSEWRKSFAPSWSFLFSAAAGLPAQTQRGPHRCLSVFFLSLIGVACGGLWEWVKPFPSNQSEWARGSSLTYANSINDKRNEAKLSRNAKPAALAAWMEAAPTNRLQLKLKACCCWWFVGLYCYNNEKKNKIILFLFSSPLFKEMKWIYEWNFFNEGECALFDGMRLMKSIEMKSMKHRSFVKCWKHLAKRAVMGMKWNQLKIKVIFNLIEWNVFSLLANTIINSLSFFAN